MARKASRASGAVDLEVQPLGTTASFGDGRWRVPADTAERVLNEPLHIFVENAECDGAFIRLATLRVAERRLRRRLGSDAFERLRTGWTNPLGDGKWLAVHHGGGSTIAAQIRLYAGAEPTAGRRIFVLLDSDREQQSAPIGTTARQTETTCTELRNESGDRLRLILHILEKREVENYFPADALRSASTTSFKQWQQLSTQEKDYADLKIIFSSKLRKLVLNAACDGYFHAGALRERAGRNGRELNQIAETLVSLL